jgi:hypothetical protein
MVKRAAQGRGHLEAIACDRGDRAVGVADPLEMVGRVGEGAVRR